MAIIKTISESEFIDAFADYNRKDNFSYYGKQELFNHYDSVGGDWYDDDDKPYELDIIAICCTWTECTTKDETISNYGYLIDDMIELERDFRDDNELSTVTDHDDDTYEKFFVESLDAEYVDEFRDIIFDAILQELEDNTTVIRIEETNTISPDMDVDGVLVHEF